MQNHVYFLVLHDVWPLLQRFAQLYSTSWPFYTDWQPCHTIPELHLVCWLPFKKNINFPWNRSDWFFKKSKIQEIALTHPNRPPKNPLDPVIFFSASWIRASPFASLSAIFTKFFDNDLLFYFFNFLREIVSYTPKEKWSICEETLANCLKRKLQTVGKPRDGFSFGTVHERLWTLKSKAKNCMEKPSNWERDLTWQLSYSLEA